MTQSRDYYEDCCSSTALTPVCKRRCCEYRPPYCYKCCSDPPCVVRKERNIYRRLAPVCAPRRPCYPVCCVPPCESVCPPPCSRPCCECVKCCDGQKNILCCCSAEEDSCDKYEVIKHLMMGIVLLAAFAILVFSFNQQMAPCKRRPFFY